MQLVINPGGFTRCVYSEEIDLSTLGRVTITRASHVEPDQLGCWMVDLSPVGGPRLGPFPLRSEALRAEELWLDAHLATPRCVANAP